MQNMFHNATVAAQHDSYCTVALKRDSYSTALLYRDNVFIDKGLEQIF